VHGRIYRSAAREFFRSNEVQTRRLNDCDKSERCGWVHTGEVRWDHSRNMAEQEWRAAKAMTIHLPRTWIRSVTRTLGAASGNCLLV
jgi:hypothetical protein